MDFLSSIVIWPTMKNSIVRATINVRGLYYDQNTFYLLKSQKLLPILSLLQTMKTLMMTKLSKRCHNSRLPVFALCTAVRVQIKHLPPWVWKMRKAGRPRSSRAPTNATVSSHANLYHGKLPQHLSDTDV